MAQNYLPGFISLSLCAKTYPQFTDESGRADRKGNHGAVFPFPSMSSFLE